ncbi:MAG: hypothetical protein N2117_12760 [Anaerolineales bacterium]|nr:hypothetical protein [Anaerolineales bacterium]
MDYFPTVPFLTRQGALEERMAFGRNRENGEIRLLLLDPAGGKAGRYALYPYCEIHHLAREDGPCPRCQSEIQNRLQSIQEVTQ